MVVVEWMGFRLLSELYSLLSSFLEAIKMKLSILFPSPLGVIFSLILIVPTVPTCLKLIVSVSSRSYILSYKEYKSFKRMLKKVSVSSRSYILSYFKRIRRWQT